MYFAFFNELLPGKGVFFLPCSLKETQSKASPLTIKKPLSLTHRNTQIWHFICFSKHKQKPKLVEFAVNQKSGSHITLVSQPQSTETWGFRPKLSCDSGGSWDFRSGLIWQENLSSQAAANPILLEPIFFETSTLVSDISPLGFSSFSASFRLQKRVEARLEGIMQGRV